VAHRENSYTYNVSSNGAAADWYWQVTRDQEIITRGIATSPGVGSRGRGEGRPLPRRSAAAKTAALHRRAIAPGRLWRSLGVSAAQRHRDNRLLAALPPDTLALLDRDLKQVSLQQGAILLEPGDPIANIYFPQTGLISLLVIGREGSAIETATVGREGAVGLHGGLGGRRSFTRATTQIGGRFSTIRAERFEHIANGSAPVRDLIQRHTEVALAEAQQTAACNAIHEAGPRLCRRLLQCADRIGSDEVPLVQEFLAQMLGVRRTTVTLLAQAMQVKGMIRYRRGHIVLLDRKGLEECACECYDIMRHDKLPRALGVRF
jgi:CRP-like cAMP-binding protein